MSAAVADILQQLKEYRFGYPPTKLVPAAIAEITALRAQVEAAEGMAEALKAYASSVNWVCPRCGGKNKLNCFMGKWAGPCDEHGYDIARESLARWDAVRKTA